MGKPPFPRQIITQDKMKTSLLALKKFDMNAICLALADMRRTCGGGDVPAKLVRSTAHALHLTPEEFAEAAARLNHPFSTNHIR